jgi:genome maintenance exonuclease 1
MKFNYQEVNAKIELGFRWYETQFGYYPSITSVLSGTKSKAAEEALAAWRAALGEEKAAEFSKRATDHGTNVHLLIERYLKHEDVKAPISGAPVPENDLKDFNALKLQLNKIEEVWGQEVPLYSTKYEVAGRCDCIGVFAGKPVIIDFKTSGRIKSDKDIEDYKVQLAFYAEAHNELFGTTIEDGVILMVSNGFPQVFKIPLKPVLPELQRRVNLFWQKTLNSISPD